MQCLNVTYVSIQRGMPLLASVAICFGEFFLSVNLVTSRLCDTDRSEFNICCLEK